MLHRRATWMGLSIIALSVGCDRPAPPAPPTPSTAPATAPTSAPATKAVEVVVPKTLADVYHADDSNFPATQPTSALPLTDAARVLVRRPLYLCPRMDLWATHASAPSIRDVLAKASQAQTHVVRETVRFIAWQITSPNDPPAAIVRDESRDVLVTTTATHPLDLGDAVPDWSRAIVYHNRIVVPTNVGVTTIALRGNASPDVQSIRLAVAAPGTTCQFLFDLKGLLAWSSSTDPTVQSNVARFVDDKWVSLTPDLRWPTSIVQLAPMSDGTVLVVRRESNTLRLGYVTLDAIQVDAAKIEALVQQLYSTSPRDRRDAMQQLGAFGSGAWPVLAKLADTQRSDVKARLRTLMGNQTDATLDGLRPLPGPARVLERWPDGVLLRFDGGVQIFDDSGASRDTVPAFVALQPGFGATLLPDAVVEALKEDFGAHVRAWGDEWIVEMSKKGPMRWMGNHLEPLLRAGEVGKVKKFVGIDSAGRWIMGNADENGPSLVVDVTIPDPTPRLPVWIIESTNPRATVGWDDEDWPCRRVGGTWALRETGWQALTEGRSKEVYRIERADAPVEADGPLLKDEFGNQYEDGRVSLVVRRRDGSTISWPLPPEARGPGIFEGRPVLLEASGALWLFNAPGKVSRIKLTPGDAEPFKLEAIFTRGLPQLDIRRIWKDRAGRLCIAAGGHRLSICFPAGTIPQPIQNVMSTKAVQEALER
ncbi:MAG: hypothetical protein QM770_14765 [Tepidisphaeraceae bacterium]